jgi:hypothetical protein
MANREKVVARYGKRWFRVSGPREQSHERCVVKSPYRSGSTSSLTPPSSLVREVPPATRLSLSRTSIRCTEWRESRASTA